MRWHGYVEVLLLVGLMAAYREVLAGCGKPSHFFQGPGPMCCEGKENSCKTLGTRINGKASKTCFCDENCLLQSDCCTDFKDVCKEQDCVLGEWEAYGQCSEACGWGVKTRMRRVLQQPRNGGKMCEKFEEKMYCYGTGCKVARHATGLMEVRETGKIIPAEFGEWRKNKFFDPFKDIRRNLFNHYSANSVIQRPPYCAKFELSTASPSCSIAAQGTNPWASKLSEGATVCVECQPLAMKKKLGVRCKGHGVFMRESRWNAVTVPGCHGKWVMKTRHEECTCDTRSHASFILI